MGPRSHERGNAIKGAWERLAEVVLQWGRVLMNAETFVGTGRIVIAQPASMGPRSHERGNSYP